MSDTIIKKAWYACSVDAVIKTLKTDPEQGLADEEAVRRLEKFGQNLLPETKKTGLLMKFLSQFNNILIYILIAAAILTFAMGHYVDTIVILLVVVINALIGFVQENRADAAMDAIKNILALEAHVVRSGTRMDVDADGLTLGDVVRLKPGDKIPADLRLIKADNLKVEESALTGEANTMEKQTEALKSGTTLADRTNLAFSGTTVSSGTGTGVVVAVGENTEIGNINRMLDEVETTTTPLLKQMNRLSTVISVVIVGIAVVVYAFGYFFRDYEPGVLALSVIGLAIAAIPEGLPAIMSIILALGVQTMAKRNAIVRNLPSVETLGSVSVICSDKTGTLTKNEMTVKNLVTQEADYAVGGLGYQPEGDITRNGEKATPENDKLLAETLTCFSVCNESELAEGENGRWIVKGEPTEGALIAAWEKSGLKKDDIARKDVIPFDSKYKYMAVLVEKAGKQVIYVKGAPDRILGMADKVETESGESALDRKFWEEKIVGLARTGQRTIAAAYKPVTGSRSELRHEDVENGLVFLGLAGIVDPPRDEAIAAVKECHEAGITVKMITGDHVETAMAIGQQLGIGNGRDGLQGKDLDGMDASALRDAVCKYDIFARTSPENKLQLVDALQANGNVCAMTGDGVNDAPALKKADIGIAMGVKGTEVTKDAAGIVLADDNFSTIAAAVEEGRKVYDNLKKTILFILPTNGAECFLIMASILFGTFMPLTPVQILWVNMVTSVTVSLALAFEPLDPEAMERPPRDPATPLIDAYFLFRIVYVSILIGGGTLFLSVMLHNSGRYDDATIRTVTMQAIVISRMCHLFNNRSLRRSAFCCGFFTNKAIFVVGALMVILQLSITYIPFMNSVFGTSPLPFRYWGYPIMLGLVVFFVVEIEKWIMRTIDKQQEGGSIGIGGGKPRVSPNA